jgi:PhzF family phenazine biosynthesis protein
LKIKVDRLSSFAETINGGNPAGVVLNADNFDEKKMKLIAKNVGYSETAFVSNSNKADFKIRFFTPKEEVNLCGHATIAAFSLLIKEKIISQGKYTQETKAGILEIECNKNSEIFMNQNLPNFQEKLNQELITNALNIDKDELLEDIPIEIVSTGLNDLMIPIKSLEALNQITPNMKKIENICNQNNIASFHLFCIPKNEFHTSSRNFAPHLGIPEESATGTASGALGCYLIKHKIYEANKQLLFQQGLSMNKPSKIKVIIEKTTTINAVKVGGKAIYLDSIYM